MLAKRYIDLQSRVAAASEKGGFKAAKILPATKGFLLKLSMSVSGCREELGISPIIAESFVGEFLSKREFLDGAFEAHFIGPLQLGSVSKIVRCFDCLHSVHSLQVLQKVRHEAERMGRGDEYIFAGEYI